MAIRDDPHRAYGGVRAAAIHILQVTRDPHPAAFHTLLVSATHCI